MPITPRYEWPWRFGIDNAALFHAIIKVVDALYQGFNAKHLPDNAPQCAVLFLVEQAKQSRQFQQSVIAATKTPTTS